MSGNSDSNGGEGASCSSRSSLSKRQSSTSLAGANQRPKRRCRQQQQEKEKLDQVADRRRSKRQMMIKRMCVGGGGSGADTPSLLSEDDLNENTSSMDSDEEISDCNDKTTATTTSVSLRGVSVKSNEFSPNSGTDVAAAAAAAASFVASSSQSKLLCHSTSDRSKCGSNSFKQFKGLSAQEIGASTNNNLETNLPLHSDKRTVSLENDTDDQPTRSSNSRNSRSTSQRSKKMVKKNVRSHLFKQRCGSSSSSTSRNSSNCSTGESNCSKLRSRNCQEVSLLNICTKTRRANSTNITTNVATATAVPKLKNSRKRTNIINTLVSSRKPNPVVPKKKTRRISHEKGDGPVKKSVKKETSAQDSPSNESISANTVVVKLECPQDGSTEVSGNCSEHLPIKREPVEECNSNEVGTSVQPNNILDTSSSAGSRVTSSSSSPSIGHVSDILNCRSMDSNAPTNTDDTVATSHMNITKILYCTNGNVSPGTVDNIVNNNHISKDDSCTATVTTSFTNLFHLSAAPNCLPSVPPQSSETCTTHTTNININSRVSVVPPCSNNNVPSLPTTTSSSVVASSPQAICHSYISPVIARSFGANLETAPDLFSLCGLSPPYMSPPPSSTVATTFTSSEYVTRNSLLGNCIFVQDSAYNQSQSVATPSQCLSIARSNSSSVLTSYGVHQPAATSSATVSCSFPIPGIEASPLPPSSLPVVRSLEQCPQSLSTSVSQPFSTSQTERDVASGLPTTQSNVEECGSTSATNCVSQSAVVHSSVPALRQLTTISTAVAPAQSLISPTAPASTQSSPIPLALDYNSAGPASAQVSDSLDQSLMSKMVLAPPTATIRAEARTIKPLLPKPLCSIFNSIPPNSTEIMPNSSSPKRTVAKSTSPRPVQKAVVKSLSQTPLPRLKSSIKTSSSPVTRNSSLSLPNTSPCVSDLSAVGVGALSPSSRTTGILSRYGLPYRIHGDSDPPQQTPNKAPAAKLMTTSGNTGVNTTMNNLVYSNVGQQTMVGNCMQTVDSQSEASNQESIQNHKEISLITSTTTTLGVTTSTTLYPLPKSPVNNFSHVEGCGDLKPEAVPSCSSYCENSQQNHTTFNQTSEETIPPAPSTLERRTDIGKDQRLVGSIATLGDEEQGTTANTSNEGSVEALSSQHQQQEQLPVTKIPISVINEHFVCKICRGYFVNATTIVVCQHTFCRSCIVPYLDGSTFCPVCEVQLHKTSPMSKLRDDTALQTLLYTLLPHLYHDEVLQREKFGEQAQGKLLPVNWSPDRPILPTVAVSPQPPLGLHDLICFQLIFCPDDAVQPLNGPRYYQCSANLSISMVKRLLRLKYNLNRSHSLLILVPDYPKIRKLRSKCKSLAEMKSNDAATSAGGGGAGAVSADTKSLESEGKLMEIHSQEIPSSSNTDLPGGLDGSSPKSLESVNETTHSISLNTLVSIACSPDPSAVELTNDVNNTNLPEAETGKSKSDVQKTDGSSDSLEKDVQSEALKNVAQADLVANVCTNTTAQEQHANSTQKIIGGNMYPGKLLLDDETLRDAAYIVGWKSNKPLRMFYRLIHNQSGKSRTATGRYAVASAHLLSIPSHLVNEDEKEPLKSSVEEETSATASLERSSLGIRSPLFSGEVQEWSAELPSQSTIRIEATKGNQVDQQIPVMTSMTSSMQNSSATPTPANEQNELCTEKDTEMPFLEPYVTVPSVAPDGTDCGSDDSSHKGMTVHDSAPLLQAEGLEKWRHVQQEQLQKQETLLHHLPKPSVAPPKDVIEPAKAPSAVIAPEPDIKPEQGFKSQKVTRPKSASTPRVAKTTAGGSRARASKKQVQVPTKTSSFTSVSASKNSTESIYATSLNGVALRSAASSTSTSALLDASGTNSINKLSSNSSSSILVSALSHQQLLLLQDQQLAQIQQLSQIQHMYSIQQQQLHHSSTLSSSTIGDSTSSMDICTAAGITPSQPFPDLNLPSLAPKAFTGHPTDNQGSSLMLDGSGSSGMHNTQFSIPGLGAGASLVYAAGNNITNISALAGNAQGINLGALAPSFNLGYSLVPFVSTCNSLDNTSTGLATLNTGGSYQPVSTLDATGNIAGAAASLVTSDSLTGFTSTGSGSSHELNSGLSLQGTLIPSFGGYSFAPGLFCLGQTNATALSAATAQSAVDCVSSQPQHVQSAVVVSNSSNEGSSAATNNALQAYASLFAASTSSSSTFGNTAAMFGIEAALNMSGLTAVMMPPPTHSPALLTNVSERDDISTSSETGSGSNNTATTYTVAATGAVSLPTGGNPIGLVTSSSSLLEGLAKISDMSGLVPQNLLTTYSTAQDNQNTGNALHSLDNQTAPDHVSSLGVSSTGTSFVNTPLSCGDVRLTPSLQQPVSSSSVVLSGDVAGERMMVTSSVHDVRHSQTPTTGTSSSSDVSSEWKEVQLKISECGVMSVSSGGQDDYMEGLLNQMESETTSQLLSTVESASVEEGRPALVHPVPNRTQSDGINVSAVSTDSVIMVNGAVGVSTTSVDPLRTELGSAAAAGRQSHATVLSLPTVPSETISSKISLQKPISGPAFPTTRAPTKVESTSSGSGAATLAQAGTLAASHPVIDKESKKATTRVSTATPTVEGSARCKAGVVTSVVAPFVTPSSVVLSSVSAHTVSSPSVSSPSVSSPCVAVKQSSKKDHGSSSKVTTSIGPPTTKSTKPITILKSGSAVETYQPSMPVVPEVNSPETKSGSNTHKMNSALSSDKVVVNDRVSMAVSSESVAKSKESSVEPCVPTGPSKVALKDSPLQVDTSPQLKSSTPACSGVPPPSPSVTADPVSCAAIQIVSKEGSSSSRAAEKPCSTDRASCETSTKKGSGINVALSCRASAPVDAKPFKSAKRKSSELLSDVQQPRTQAPENKKPLKDLKRKSDVIQSDDDGGGPKRLKIDISEVANPSKSLKLGSSSPKPESGREERPVMNRKTSKLKEIAEKQKLVTGKSHSNNAFLSQVDTLDNPSKADMVKLGASIGFNSHIPANLAAATLANLKNLNKLHTAPPFGMLPMKLDGGSKGDGSGGGNSKSLSGRKSQSIGYKTLNTSPRGWNPTISREHIQMGVVASGGGSSPKTNKFFKARNAPKIFTPLSAFKTPSSPLAGADNSTNKKEGSSSAGSKTNSSVGVASVAASVKEKSGSNSLSASCTSSSTHSKESHNPKSNASSGKSSPRTSPRAAPSSASSQVKGFSNVPRPAATGDKSSFRASASAQALATSSATAATSTTPEPVAGAAATTISVACSSLDNVNGRNNSVKVAADSIDPSQPGSPGIEKYGINTTVLETNRRSGVTSKSSVVVTQTGSVIDAIASTLPSAVSATVSSVIDDPPVAGGCVTAPVCSVAKGKEDPCGTVSVVDSRPSACQDRGEGSVTSVLSRGALESAVSCARLSDSSRSASYSFPIAGPVDNNRSSALVNNCSRMSPNNVCIVSLINFSHNAFALFSFSLINFSLFNFFHQCFSLYHL